MNYVALGNRYWKLHGEEAFQPSESHLYWCLLNIFNGKGKRDDWPDSLKMTDGTWAMAAAVNVKTVDKIRKRLEDRGLLLSDSVGQGARNGRTYWLIDEYGNPPITYPKKGEVQGEVQTGTSPKNGDDAGEVRGMTSPKNGEVNKPLPHEPLHKPTQNLETFVEKSPIYTEFQTGNRETQTVNTHTKKRCAQKAITGFLKAKKRKAPFVPRVSPKPTRPAIPKGDPFLRKRNAESVNVPFSQWWPLYAKGIKEHRCRALWVELSDEERTKVLEHTPGYVAATPNKQYRKNPENYLEDKTFNDEIIPRTNGRENQRNSNAGSSPPQTGKPFGEWGGRRFGKREPSEG